MPRIDRSRVLAAAVVAVVALGVVACGGGGEGSAGSGPARPGFLFEPRPVPSIELTEVGGGSINPAELSGKVRMIDFWATWCAPCVEAIPQFKELYARYGPEGFVLIGVAMDEEGTAVVGPFVEKHEIPWITVLGNEATAEAFGGMPGYPTTFLVDRKGTIVERLTGAVPESVLEKKIEVLLGDSGDAAESAEGVTARR